MLPTSRVIQLLTSKGNRPTCVALDYALGAGSRPRRVSIFDSVPCGRQCVRVGCGSAPVCLVESASERATPRLRTGSLSATEVLPSHTPNPYSRLLSTDTTNAYA